MEDIGATSFTLAEAVVELVANSIDARRYDQDGAPIPLTVNIDVQSESVSVVDDGKGMVEDVLVQAVRLGVKMDDILGKQKRKGMYGLGLKTAAASIGRYWSILTRPVEGDKDYFLEFNLERYAKSKTNSVSDWVIEVESRARTKDSVLENRKSGTAVVIKKLRDTSPMAGSVTKLLGDAYKPHLAAGDTIEVNGEPANPTDYTFLKDSREEFDEKCGTEGQWRIHGWVALDSKTHNNGEYGFNLYREKQLIETWDKSWFRAHLMTSRIIGEAHIDYMPVNFNKQGFKTQSEEWICTKEHMRQYLGPVVAASGAASRGRGDATKHQRAVEGMKKALRGISPVTGIVDGEAPEQGADSQSSNGDGGAPTVTYEKIVIRGHEVYPSYEITAWGSEITPWDYVYEDFDNDKRTDVRASLNSASLLYIKIKDPTELCLIAVADCITRYLVERRSLDPREARELRDQWIHAALISKQAKAPISS